MRAWMIAAVLVACGGGGGHTVEQLEAAAGGVNAFQKWDEAAPKVEAALGAADKTTGEGEAQVLTWYAQAEGGCKALTLSRMGDVVATVGISDEACP